MTANTGSHAVSKFCYIFSVNESDCQVVKSFERLVFGVFRPAKEMGMGL